MAQQANLTEITARLISATAALDPLMVAGALADGVFPQARGGKIALVSHLVRRLSRQEGADFAHDCARALVRD
jgi:hypothetical protein